MAYTAISDSELLPEKPITTSLLSRLRDNAIAIAQGLSGAPRIKPVILHVRDEKSAGTAGGTFNSGSWQTRTLNTTKTNDIAGASLSSNQITLPAGEYEIDATAPGYTVDEHIAKLRNVTDSADLVIGTMEVALNSSSASRSRVRGRFTLAATKVLELQHRCATGRNTVGLGGGAIDFGVVQIFSEVIITKVA